VPQVPPLHPVHETRSNLISEGSNFEGKLNLDVITRFHGKLKGDLIGKPDCKIILGESSYIEGSIRADVLFVSGYVKGSIKAESRVVLTSSARVFGDIQTPAIAIEAGAIYEGECKIIEKPFRTILDPLPTPV